MGRQSYLQFGPKIVGVVKLCKIARLDTRSTDLFLKSDIRFKRSFFNYLDYCVEKNLIEKVIAKIHPRSKKTFILYRTTDQGHELLNILGENN